MARNTRFRLRVVRRTPIDQQKYLTALWAVAQQQLREQKAAEERKRREASHD
jgi:hypothetical protein